MAQGSRALDRYYQGPPPASELQRRFSRAIDKGKAIRLSPADVDLMVVSGAYEVLTQYAAEQLREISSARLAKSAPEDRG